MAARQQTPAPNQQPVSRPTAANMPLNTDLATPNKPLMANMPLTGVLKQPANVQPVMVSQQTPATAQPLLSGQQAPAAAQLQLQPLVTSPEGPTNVQKYMPSQQSPTNLQQLIPSHQTPANMQLLNRPTPLMGQKQTPVGVQPQPGSKQIMQPMFKADRQMFSASDDNALSRQIQTTHVPDGRVIDVKPLLQVVEDIFKRAVPSVEAITTSGKETLALTDASWDDKIYQSSFVRMLEALAYLIDRIACEMTCKCSGGGDTHATALAILNVLTSYSWEAKLALALSAFAVTYGEFWLVAQSYTSNQLAKAMAILKQLPEILENSMVLKPQFDAIKNLIRAMVNISKCIFEFSEIPSHYITEDFEALTIAMTHIPVAVYWTIRSMLACTSQLIGLTLLGREHMVSTTEAWELSSLAHKLSNMDSHLRAQLRKCYEYVDEKKFLEAYQNLIHLFETVHIDNMRVLKALIYQKDDLQPLVDGITKKTVNLDVLRRKNVLLLISDLDISQEELAILEQIYNEARGQQTRHDTHYEVVWLPILDSTFIWTETKRKQFEDLQAAMPWYTVQHPSLIDRAVVKYVKEYWNFGKKAILVVLDPQGKVVCKNALPMMWIWGSVAFPFTTSREEALWREESWRLELLVDGIDQVILNWIAERKYICLYGGEDIEWIRNFTTTAAAVAKAAGIALEMVYVGKSNPKERVRRNNSVIANEKLSHYWAELTSIWYFWIRLESMWHSKSQLGRTVENDQILHEIMALLSYDGSEGGWAVFARGSAELIRAKGGTILTCLQQYNTWKELVPELGFLPAVQEHLKKLHTPHHCNRLVLPGAAGMIQEKVVCSECGRPMERYIMYKCCDE